LRATTTRESDSVLRVSANTDQYPSDIAVLQARLAIARAERDAAIAERDQALAQNHRI
jgi:DNA polymerase III delta prime subunit